jgi:hypothetical protein
MVKCNACGGTYEPLQDDGLQYFHACPPLSAPELAAKVAAGKIVLPGGETADQAVQRRMYERANKRDENLKSTDPKDAGSLKAAGDGTAGAVKPPGSIIVPK